VLFALSDEQDFGLARANPDGTLDTGFGVDGRLRTDLGGAYESPAGVALYPDGRILLAGWSDVSAEAGSRFALARYLPDGRIDRGFGRRGRVLADLGAEDQQARAVSVAWDGTVVVAGTYAARTADLDRDDVAVLLRFTPDGTPDRSFGAAGQVRYDPTPPSGTDAFTGVQRLPGGELLVTADVGWLGDTVVARYDPTGAPERAFHVAGPRGSGGHVSGAAALPDGDALVLAGTRDATTNQATAVVQRYLG